MMADSMPTPIRCRSFIRWKHSFSCRLRIYAPLAALCLTFAATPAAWGWTVHVTFNGGTEGEPANEAPFSAFSGTTYTREQSFEGGMGVILHARRGKENFGYWGGSVNFPTNLVRGDEIWWRVRTRWPAGQSYESNPWLKFLRIHTRTAAETNHGYDDLYIANPGSDQPFRAIYEGGGAWRTCGTPADAIQPDAWETYEMYLRLDTLSVSNGGMARVRVWKNGKLLREFDDQPTLKAADGYADFAYLFSYWNSDPWRGRFTYASGGPFQQGEMVLGSLYTHTAFRVEQLLTNGIELYHPEPDWQQRVKPFDVLAVGETLTGQTSGHTAVVTGVYHTHPVADVHMYVDDIYMTNETPAGRDAHGNPITDPCNDSAPGLPTGVRVETVE
ncbi:MAG: hypothetical protein JXR37_05100 [Kiritimatiellae bacterium]|nr:hypothetical protein [Kiritimatiellia bacterium]